MVYYKLFLTLLITCVLPMNIHSIEPLNIENIRTLNEKIVTCSSFEEKIAELEQEKSVAATIQQIPEVVQFLSTANSEQNYVLILAAALDQFPTLFSDFNHISNKQVALQRLVDTLVQIDQFYQPIGGLLGYHSTLLNLLNKNETCTDTFLPPPYEDIRNPNEESWTYCYEGCKRLPQLAYIFPIGGAGDRLRLLDSTTQSPLPSACLIFNGRSLFENLIRDVEAQEYWHYKVFNSQITTPIVIMSSHEKKNDYYIDQMLVNAKWFGRPKDRVRRIVQPLAPLIDLNGQWVVTEPLQLALKPGGHGIIWKLAQNSGVFHWLQKQQIEASIVRQINNPLAGLDDSLSILGGYGLSQEKAFGFLSCPSIPGMSEGLNILSINENKAAISNIEYTKFTDLKKELPHLFKEGVCPANTNLLYANIKDIERALMHDPFPGMIVNAKTMVDVKRNGKIEQIQSGRLESSMQNIADSFASPIDTTNQKSISANSLSTFLVLQEREKFFSVAKKALQPGQSPSETPASALYDWNIALRSLLQKSCLFTLPPQQSLDNFIKEGPSFTFSFNPTLGPLWKVISQKISRGTIKKGSELELEIAEISCHDLELDGSLRIIAKAPTKSLSSQKKIFSDKIGRAKIENLIVCNKGIKNHTVSNALQGIFDREETCTIILEGFSEIEAHNVTISGPFYLIVPNGQKATLKQGPSGEVLTTFETITTPSWAYTISWEKGKAPLLTQ